MEFIYLCLFAFVSGFVNSLAGGGGLIQLPALFLFLPEDQSESVASVLGTSKLSSICGNAMAAAQYGMRIKINWRAMAPAGIVAFVFSGAGAWTVVALEGRELNLKPVVLVLLIAVAAYTFFGKEFGKVHLPRLSRRNEFWATLGVGALAGFYDGFFGPGTGSFLIFIFIGVFGYDFMTSVTSAKILNFATNLSATIYFAAAGKILYVYALPMGICNVLGAAVGARLAMLKGNQFVRGFFLVVVMGMIVRFGWDVFFGE